LRRRSRLDGFGEVFLCFGGIARQVKINSHRVVGGRGIGRLLHLLAEEIARFGKFAFAKQLLPLAHLRRGRLRYQKGADREQTECAHG